MHYGIIRSWLEFLGGVVYRLLNATVTTAANWTDEESIITAVANKYGRYFVQVYMRVQSWLEVS
jgi:hypothetical protein